MKKLLLVSCFFVFIGTGCSPQNNIDKTEEPDTNSPSMQPSDETLIESLDVTDYFMPNESTAYFEGVGNEYASYSLYTKQLNDRYVATIIDNGGATVQRIYRITNQQIDIVLEEVIDGLAENATFPEVTELDTLPVKEVYFKQPLEVGETFGKWTVTAQDAELSTPYQSFQNVIVLEEQSEEWLNRHYFVKGYGIVKQEAIMQQIDENDEPFIVTSTLKSIQLK